MKKILFVASIILLISSCTSKKNNEIGSWTAINFSNQPLTWIFDKNGEINSILGNQIVTYKYKINHNKKPMWIDLKVEGDPETLMGIIKFIDDKTFAITINEPKQPRPTDFDGLGVKPPLVFHRNK